jgi:hypothetical protein
MSIHHTDSKSDVTSKTAPLSKETIGAYCWWPDGAATYKVETGALGRVGYTLESRNINMYARSFITRIYVYHAGWWHQVGVKCFGNQRRARLWSLQELEIPAAWRLLLLDTQNMQAPLWARMEDPC